jgi:dolichol kinase
MITFLLAAIYFLVLFMAIEYVSRRATFPVELSRKLAHILAGMSAAFLPWIMPYSSIALLAGIFFVVMIFSRRLRIFTSIHDVTRSSYGELFFPIVIGSMALFFPQNNLYVYGVLVMALADGFAGLAGSFYGREIYNLGRARKSYLGSGVFFLVCSGIGWMVAPQPGVIVIAILLTFVEAVGAKGTDNLILPPIAAILMATLLG